jgi:L-lactate dehydrogenase complex protein LldG
VSAAREAVLARVRAALASGPAEAAPVPRGYRRSPPPGDPVARFVERAGEYRARVERVAPGDLAAVLTAACAERGAARLAVPDDLPAAWRPDGVELVGGPLTAAALDRLDGVLTGCALAIAETGTIALDGGPAQGARALTLVPDYHLCVVLAEQIVATVPEAVARLGAAVRERRAPVTLISGPSATSDIELDRVEGVHGPRTLHVLVAG